jgi:hypothetical protein
LERDDKWVGCRGWGEQGKAGAGGLRREGSTVPRGVRVGQKALEITTSAPLPVT